MVWTLIEPGVAIIAASLVTIRPLLQKLKIHGFSSAGNSTAKSGGYNNGRSGQSGGGVGPRSRDVPGNRPGDLTLIDMEAQGYDDRLSPTGDDSGIKVSSTVAVHSSRIPGSSSAETIGDGTENYNAVISSEGGRQGAYNPRRASPTSWLNTEEARSAMGSQGAVNAWPWRGGSSETSEDILEEDLARRNPNSLRFA
jgi:hypothetical protein